MLTNIFYFTKKERKQLCILMMVVLSAVCFNKIITVDPANIMTEKNIQPIFKQKEVVDDKKFVADKKLIDAKTNNSLTLYSFDPNTVSKEELEAMNLPRKGIKSLLNYRHKGGYIKNVKDFKRMYGFENLNESLLLEYLQIKIKKQQYNYAKPKYAKSKVDTEKDITNSNVLSEYSYKSKQSNTFQFYERAPAKKLHIGINSADTIQLQQLKGIGPLRAKMIVKFREALGGYHSLKQLNEVHYLPDSIIQKISNQIFLDSIEIRKIKINKATQTDLSSHPYVSWQEARMLYNFTKEHGPITEFSALYQLRGLDSTFMIRVKPYIDLAE